jgi:glycosyltransferase involved in cell wall biosynthesis
MHRYERRFKESGGFFRYRYRENYYKSILNIAAAVFVDSKLGVQHVKESFPIIKSKIFILPYIAPDYIYSENTNEYLYSKSTKVPENYIFYPAQFWPHKNHINLLKSLLILRKRGENVNLILSGNKNREYWNLEKFVEKNGLVEQVKFMGHIPDLELIHLYKNALALVMPTFYGPTNIPPIEAILLGCPPIVSNIYAMGDQFENAALYFDPEDPNDIAEKIYLVLKNSDIRDTLIKKGEMIRKKFSQDRFRVDVEKMISELCEF